MKTTKPEESIFNKLCEIDAQIDALILSAIEAGRYQLAFVFLKALKVFIRLAKEAALDGVVIREEEQWPPYSW